MGSPYGFRAAAYGAPSGAERGGGLISNIVDLGTGGIGGLALSLGKRIFGGLFNRGAEKRKAKNAQKAAQYHVNQKQKGLNRRQYNLAALHKALKREGWYGPEYMQQYGTPNLKDWRYDPVPLEATQGGLSAFAEGAVGGASDFFGDAEAAARDADAQRGGRLPGRGYY